ncbi:MAG: Rpn family recombination-promoting nuclease/putative transposase [Coriobacteriales bacterium]|nr:Rpn family recombination-promoting nuclease/putative transposase [Coriobacteriales bacterium]
MAKLDYTFTHDTLFKLLFVRHQDLLKHLVAAVLGISVDALTGFRVTNQGIPPASMGDKFCRLDIAMEVGGDKVSLEVQVADDGDYPERSLYYWARGYSSALSAGGSYGDLPKVIVISILGFALFDAAHYHSKFQLLETGRHERLTDRLAMHYFEVGKLPEDINTENELEPLLALFKARTEEDIEQLTALEVPIVTQAVKAYREVTVSPEFRELERLRELARYNEASALRNAERTGEQKANE